MKSIFSLIMIKRILLGVSSLVTVLAVAFTFTLTPANANGGTPEGYKVVGDDCPTKSGICAVITPDDDEQ